MKSLILVALAIFVFASQPSKPPEGNRATEGKSAKVGKQAETSNQHETPTVNSPPACDPACVGKDQKPAESLNNAAPKPNDDIEIQRKLVTFTGLLVLVGALQFIALVVQSIVFYFTLTAIQAAGAQTDRMIEEASKQADAARQAV